MPLEIACFTAPSALLAAVSGADRIELCANYSLGGTTPSLSTLSTIQRSLTALALTTPIHIMIRPRGGDFTPSAPEFTQMKSSIQDFKSHPLVCGFVFGILTPSLEIDELKNRELVDAAAPLPCTFHRAVDEVGDLDAAVESIIACGFASVLTSGGAGSAWKGRGRVAGLQGRFGGRISVVLGGGMRSGNVRELRGETGVEWVHSAAITGEGEEVDEQEVRRMVGLLRSG